MHRAPLAAQPGLQAAARHCVTAAAGQPLPRRAQRLNGLGLLKLRKTHLCLHHDVLAPRFSKLQPRLLLCCDATSIGQPQLRGDCCLCRLHSISGSLVQLSACQRDWNCALRNCNLHALQWLHFLGRNARQNACFKRQLA